MPTSDTSKTLVVGAGGIGGVLSGTLLRAGHDVAVLSTNAAIVEALRETGFSVREARGVFAVPAGPVLQRPGDAPHPFDFIVLATQPPQVEEAARSVVELLSPRGRIVCLQNGLCEARVAPIAGAERVVGAVVAWGASMLAPGVYERTSEGGFSIGRLEGRIDECAAEFGRVLADVGPVRLTDNLIGARFSKLAINCAISTLGTIGGDRVGALLRFRFVRRLALEIMTEVVAVAAREGVLLEKVSGTIDLPWVVRPLASGPPAPSVALALRHALLVGVGLKYRRLRSSMLSAIERGRTPAVDFLNGEVALLGERHCVPVPVNETARAVVWRIAEGRERPGLAALQALYESTR